ncbi:MAG TPA: amidohydrolase family protein [Flavipsychrobacter sp.]|nr:amidohydrolase family protein [Flavipsychrobacter sp.]
MLFTAPLIHNGYKFLPAGSMVEVNDSGVITAIHYGLQNEDVIEYQGILCPGFVNVHCHLELSHLRNSIPEHTGLIPFLQQIPIIRGKFSREEIRFARHEAYQELRNHGVVAVGDIANVTDTLDLRALNDLHVHTFVECIGFTEQYAPQRFKASRHTYKTFAAQQQKDKILRQSIVPHAPYSVSKTLFDFIDKHQPQSIISIHNQESLAENEFYQNKTGAVNNLLSGLGIEYDFFQATGKSSLQTYTQWLSDEHPIIFVHNTYTTKEDVEIAVDRFRQTYWCLCPNANLYIENTLPDVTMLAAAGLNMCIGTDSLASNHQLCVFSELLTLKKKIPLLQWEVLLQWATSNGAKALDMNEQVGSLEVGKQPGLLNISDLSESANPVIERII